MIRYHPCRPSPAGKKGQSRITYRIGIGKLNPLFLSLYLEKSRWHKDFRLLALYCHELNLIICLEGIRRPECGAV